MERLSAYNRSISRCESRASWARLLACMEKRLAVMEVARNANSATQFCGSAMVKVPIGGKKKKLKHSTATMEPAIDSTSPHRAAINRMATRYAKAAVVAFTGTARKQIHVIAAMTPATITVRIANCMI